MHNQNSKWNCWLQLFVALLAIVTSVHTTLAGDVSDAIREAMQLENGPTFFIADRMSGLSRMLSPDDILGLMTDASDPVAVVARWKRFVLHTQDAYLQHGFKELGTPLPGSEAKEFVAFVEGRLNVIVPTQWKKCLVSGTYYGDDWFSFDPVFDYPYVDSPFGQLETSPNIVAELAQTELQLQFPEFSINLTGAAFNSMCNEAGNWTWPRLAALHDKDRKRTVVIAHSRAAKGIALCVSDDSPNEVIWRHDIDVYSTPGFGGDDCLWFSPVATGSGYVLFYGASEMGFTWIAADGKQSWWFGTGMLSSGDSLREVTPVED